MTNLINKWAEYILKESQDINEVSDIDIDPNTWDDDNSKVNGYKEQYRKMYSKAEILSDKFNALNKEDKSYAIVDIASSIADHLSKEDSKNLVDYMKRVSHHSYSKSKHSEILELFFDILMDAADNSPKFMNNHQISTVHHEEGLEKQREIDKDEI